MQTTFKRKYGSTVINENRKSGKLERNSLEIVQKETNSTKGNKC